MKLVFGTDLNDQIYTEPGDNYFLIGGGGSDRLVTLEGDDLIAGGTGNDTIRSGAGNDTAEGNDGRDTIIAGAGNDSVTGGRGDDAIYGKSGGDVLAGSSGHDAIFGGAGVDYIEGNDGNDTLSGGSDNDYLNGGAGKDVIIGGSGADIVDAGAGADVILGGAGNDTLHGQGGNDQLSGGSGNDLLDGGTGHDLLNGGSGDDLMIAGANSSRYVGGSGTDTLSLASLGSDRYVEVDVSSHSVKVYDLYTGAELSHSYVDGVERIESGAAIMHYMGSNDAETFVAGSDGDYIRGKGGSDILTGGDGADMFVWLKKDTAGGAVDHITDFQVGIDLLELNDFTKGKTGTNFEDVVRIVDTADHSGALVQGLVAGNWQSIAILDGHDAANLSLHDLGLV